MATTFINTRLLSSIVGQQTTQPNADLHHHHSGATISNCFWRRCDHRAVVVYKWFSLHWWSCSLYGFASFPRPPMLGGTWGGMFIIKSERFLRERAPPLHLKMIAHHQNWSYSPPIPAGDWWMLWTRPRFRLRNKARNFGELLLSKWLDELYILSQTIVATVIGFRVLSEKCLYLDSSIVSCLCNQLWEW